MIMLYYTVQYYRYSNSYRSVWESKVGDNDDDDKWTEYWLLTSDLSGSLH